jgi:zinc D-Ala-D-Ala carboxypeptidase
VVKISPHFDSDEFKCKCGKCIGGKVSAKLLMILEDVRTEYAKPMTITSGGRCEDWNRHEGGEPNSYHLFNETTPIRAVDIFCPNSYDRYQLIKLAMKYGIGGIGVGLGFIHFDIGPPRVFDYYKRRTNLQFC